MDIDRCPMPSRAEDLGLGSIKSFSARMSKHISFFRPDGDNPVEQEGFHESPGFSDNPKSQSQKLLGSHACKQKPNHLHFETVNYGRSLCVLGKDMTCTMVEALSERALVGRFEYIKLTRVDILPWIRSKWKSFLTNIPRVMTLINGWVVFHFLLVEDREPIERHFWVINMGSLVLAPWTFGFDPQKTRMERRHLRVILPGFRFSIGIYRV